MSVQLSSLENFDVKNIIVSEPKTDQIKEDGKLISFQRIGIQVKYPDGNKGDLIFPTSELFSFGISESVNSTTGLVESKSLSLCLWNRDKNTGKYIPTKEQKLFTDTLYLVGQEIKNRLKTLFEDKKLLPILYRNKSTSFSNIEGQIDCCPLYWGKNMFDEIETPGCPNTYENGPTLYGRLIESKKNNKILTHFTDFAGNEINDPFERFNSAKKMYCTVIAAIRIESIFISGAGKIKVQYKVYEAQCKSIESGVKRLLPRRQEQVSCDVEETDDNFGNLNDNGSINDEEETKDDDDEEEEEEIVEKSPQKPKLKSSKFTKKVIKVTNEDD